MKTSISQIIDNSTNNVKVTLFCDENGKISSIGFPAEDLTSHEISKSFENEVDKALELYKKSNSEENKMEINPDAQVSKEVLDMTLKKIKSKDILFVGESLKNRTFTDKDNNVWKYDAATQELITDNPYNLKLTDNDEDTSSNYTPKM